jgi:hypothetical protein
MPNTFPDKYNLFNDQRVKNIAIVVEIPGVDLLSNRHIYTRIRYGDVDLKYGLPLPDGTIPVYGGLRRLAGVRPIINLDGGLSISQRLEPEAGRASISQLQMQFIDKDEYMSQVLSPGVIVPEILGRNVKIHLGFADVSFPEDYVVIFRGKISDVSIQSGMASMLFSDPNLQRRQEICKTAKSRLVGDIDSSVTSITTDFTDDYTQPILGPDGLYDVPRPWNQDGTHNALAVRREGVRTFIKIDDEFMEYGPLGITGPSSFAGLLRGARGTTAAAHESAAEITGYVEIQGHCIDMALKLMLSGYAGYWLKKVAINSLVNTEDAEIGDQPTAIIMRMGLDVVDKYGIVEGDYFLLEDSDFPENNITGKIVRFGDLGGFKNRIIYTDQTFTPDDPSAAKISFRSQYDTYPKTMGVKLTPDDVDVPEHLALRNRFLSDIENSYRFLISEEENCKNFIETEIYKPMACYSLTKRGKLSIGYTHPPLSNSELVFLNESNVLNPTEIRPSRSMNTARKFYNEVDYDYNFNDEGNPKKFLRYVDVDSISTMDIVSIMPVVSRGLRSDLGADDLIIKRAKKFLSRYRRAAMMLDIQTNYGTGCKVESGDVVALNGDNLKITNFSQGDREFGVQLMEVVDRELDLESGVTTLALVAGVNSDVTDRFAVISPSSNLAAGSTMDYIIIKDSYGSLYPGNESRKWKRALGQQVRIHDENYTFVETITIDSIDPVNNYKIHCTGITTPYAADYVMDIPEFPKTTRKSDQSFYKAQYAFFSARIPIVSGTTSSQFDVSPSDIGRFFVGAKIIVHTEEYTVVSPEVKVLEVIGNTVSCASTLGFTPDSTYYVDGIGFYDKSGFYRYL